MRANSENCRGFVDFVLGFRHSSHAASPQTPSPAAVKPLDEMRTQQQHELGGFFFDYQDDQVCLLGGIQQGEREHSAC